MLSYPIVFIPPNIQQTKSALPTVAEFLETQPPPAGKEPQPVSVGIVIALITATLAASLALALINQINLINPTVAWIAIFFFLVSAAAIAITTMAMWQSYPARQQKFVQQIKVIAAYQERKQQHESYVKALLSPEAVAEFRQLQLLKNLRQAIAPDGYQSDAVKGYAEPEFKTQLKRYFDGKIYTELTLDAPNRSDGISALYTPDFAYIDRALSVYIDIELDEPYDYLDGKPAHFAGNTLDAAHNEFFIARGWIVVRFSEAQAVISPQSCCKEVARVIANILGDSLELSQFAMIADLPPMPQWTEAEAIVLAASHHRDSYLNL